MLLAAAPARAAEAPTDVALVLVTDVSRSIDDTEFALEKQGYAAAFADPRVIAAIQAGPLGHISVAYVEFSGPDQVRALLRWTVISDAPSAAAFAATLTALPRSSYGRTAIGAGIDVAAAMLAQGGFGDARRVIDVAGDGTNNAGHADHRGAGRRRWPSGITINGLTIINDHPVSYTFAHVQPPGGLTERGTGRTSPADPAASSSRCTTSRTFGAGDVAQAAERDRRPSPSATAESDTRMQQRNHGPLGPAGLHASGWAATISAAASTWRRRAAVVHAALDAGITLFDTADVYGALGIGSSRPATRAHRRRYWAPSLARTGARW